MKQTWQRSDIVGANQQEVQDRGELDHHRRVKRPDRQTEEYNIGNGGEDKQEEEENLEMSEHPNEVPEDEVTLEPSLVSEEETRPQRQQRPPQRLNPETGNN